MKSPIDKKSPETDLSLSDEDFECKKKLNPKTNCPTQKKKILIVVISMIL